MVQFAESSHNRVMRQYESDLNAAKASDPDARADRRKSIEDSLVEEGAIAIAEYEKLLDKRWDAANCLAEYDGIRMAYGILNRAKRRFAALSPDIPHPTA